jgi:hypothetical protein
MQQKTLASTKNRILSRLSAADMALLKPDLEPVTSRFGMFSRGRTSPSVTATSLNMGLLPSSPLADTNGWKLGSSAAKA